MISRRAVLTGALGAALAGAGRGTATTHRSSTAPMSGSGDAGLDLLEAVFRGMQVDDTWSVREPRRFTWWGHGLAQRVWAEPPRRSEGFEVCRVHAETDLVRNVLTLRCGVYVHPQNLSWLSRLCLAAVGLQAADAHIKAPALARLLGGEPDTSPHPRRGWRRHADAMLGVIEQVFAPEGRRPSPFTEADFRAALELTPRPWVLATGNGAGLTAELPFVDDIPAIQGGQGTALLMATATDRHPQLGSGALLRLILPALPSAGRTDAEPAADLNRAEPAAWAVAHFLGAWTADPDRGLTFVVFLPAAVYRQRLLDAMLLNMAARAQWASAYLGARR